MARARSGVMFSLTMAAQWMMGVLVSARRSNLSSVVRQAEPRQCDVAAQRVEAAVPGIACGQLPLRRHRLQPGARGLVVGRADQQRDVCALVPQQAR